MHYVRFLKTPKFHVEKGSVILKAVVTITTDFGETFYAHDISLAATLRSPDYEGDVYLRRTINWEDGMRSVPISFDLSRTEVDWPARLHVGLKSRHSATDCADHLEIFNPAGASPAVVSVWSEILHPTKGALDSSTRVERKFMPLNDRQINIYEDTGESIARHLWDGSLALTAYIDRIVALQAPSAMPLLEHALVAATFKKINVIELGCGCGVVGIALAQSIVDCDVVLTDLSEVDELVKRNIEIAKPAISSALKFVPLDWEQPLPKALRSRTFDIIVAAECIYNTDSIPPLVQTLADLIAKSPKAVILVATKPRHDSEALFFDLAKKKGLIQSSKISLPLPGEPGYGYGDSAVQVDVYCYHGKSYRQGYSPQGVDRAVLSLSDSS